jgi:hypothetical protein
MKKIPVPPRDWLDKKLMTILNFIQVSSPFIYKMVYYNHTWLPAT